jgi:hypothetical protein
MNEEPSLVHLQTGWTGREEAEAIGDVEGAGLEGVESGCEGEAQGVGVTIDNVAG